MMNILLKFKVLRALKGRAEKEKNMTAVDHCKAQLAEKKQEFQKEVGEIGKGGDDYLSTIENK